MWWKPSVDVKSERPSAWDIQLRVVRAANERRRDLASAEANYKLSVYEIEKRYAQQVGTIHGEYEGVAR